jgi:hypothetical protein
VTQPRVATQLVIAGDPAVRYLIAPRVEHCSTLLVSRVIPHLLWHVTFLAPLLIVCPVLGQGQAEVEQGMIVVTDIAHEDTDLAVVDFSPVAAPLPFDAHRMGAALGEAAGIEGDNPSARSIDQPLHQPIHGSTAGGPWRCP